MYNRFENGVHPREPLSDMLVAAKDHISSLEDHILFLQKVNKVWEISLWNILKHS